MFPQNLTSPKLTDQTLKRLLVKVNASHNPMYIDVIPEVGAKINECFNNVERKIMKEGGKRILGWQVWRGKYVMEAEAHAVWESPDEDLIDITPKSGNLPQILFVEDEKLTYHGCQINSFRMNHTKNSLVDDLIKICEQIFEFENKGERASHHNLEQILTPEQKSHWIILQQWKSTIIQLLDSGRNRKSLCACNSGRIFEICHRLKFLKDICLIQ